MEVRWDNIVGLLFLILGMVFYSFSISLGFIICQIIVSIFLIVGLDSKPSQSVTEDKNG